MNTAVICRDLIKQYNEEMHNGSDLQGEDLYTLAWDEQEDFYKWFIRQSKIEKTDKAQHTPGEWMIEKSDFETINIVVENGFICEIPSNGLSIHKECREEAQANAQLIASAPEMLEVLQSAFNRLWELRDSDTICEQDREIIIDIETTILNITRKATNS